MKRIVVATVVAAAAVLIGLAATFYNRNLKGVWPAVDRPPENIAEVLNTTGMPLNLPRGFSISIFAENLGTPRVVIVDPENNLLVSCTSQGRVVALPDSNGDGVADRIVTVADGLNYPHGLAIRRAKGYELYIAETDAVAVYDYDQKSFKALNRRKIVDLPGGGRHFTRTLLFVPASEAAGAGGARGDTGAGSGSAPTAAGAEKLLISIGSDCNVCVEKDWHRAKILVCDPDGGNLRVFASGLRNSVFMAIHPVTGQVWATEMGRDFLGDNEPSDEINIIEEGKDYGWPICYGENTHDTAFDKKVHARNPCREPEETPAYIDIPAHSAPLGLVFIPTEGWPRGYRYNLLVAYHGSWNRTVPTGYKIVRFRLDEQGRELGVEDFISGWLTPSDRALGRPVGLLTGPGGELYVTDDKAGVVYRVVYHGQ
jgi:glucose/arabinose dehydrogenase